MKYYRHSFSSLEDLAGKQPITKKSWIKSVLDYFARLFGR